MMLLVVAVGAVGLLLQTPQPFPKVAPPTSRPATPAEAAPAQKVAPPTRPPAAPGGAPDVPTEAMLGVAIYPSAEFLVSYDAGRGQRYYLFGTNASFTEIVNYYKNVLKQKGELIYEEPAIHQFETGKFVEEAMAFPPSVTVKDYTWGGSAGYLQPRRGQPSARFKTIIQIVPAVPGK